MELWSFPLGRLFGVEVRLHLLFALLLAGCSLWAAASGQNPMRGLLLWFALLLAVLLRELSHSLAAAWCGLPVRGLLLLPTGGLLQIPGGAQPLSTTMRQVMAFTGPLSSLIAGLVLAGACLAASPSLDLLTQPWVSPAHLLRSFVWLNLFLGAANLMPAWPLDGGRLAEPRKEAALTGGLNSRRPELLRNGREPAKRHLMPLLLAIVLVIAGLVTGKWWVLAGGMAALLFAQSVQHGLRSTGLADGVVVGDVMLTDYSVLPASATLEDALQHARHTLQDWFLVVRGEAIVGAISRKLATDTVERNGNGFVQGTMRRRFVTAGPGDLVAEVLGRWTLQVGDETASLVPVLEGEQVIGVLTPEHLRRAMTLLQRDRAVRTARQLLENDR